MVTKMGETLLCGSVNIYPELRPFCGDLLLLPIAIDYSPVTNQHTFTIEPSVVPSTMGVDREVLAWCVLLGVRKGRDQ